MEQFVARRAHNPEVRGSNSPRNQFFLGLHGGVAQLVRARAVHPRRHAVRIHYRYQIHARQLSRLEHLTLNQGVRVRVPWRGTTQKPLSFPGGLYLQFRVAVRTRTPQASDAWVGLSGVRGMLHSSHSLAGTTNLSFPEVFSYTCS